MSCFLYAFVPCRMSVQSHIVPFSCSRGWLVREMDNSWGRETRVASGFLAAQLTFSDLLFCLACRELTCMDWRLGWHCGMGGMVQKPLRDTWYNSVNPELEIRGPELWAQLYSNELATRTWANDRISQGLSFLALEIKVWAGLFGSGRGYCAAMLMTPEAFPLWLSRNPGFLGWWRCF